MEALVQYTQKEEYQYSNNMHNMVKWDLCDFGKNEKRKVLYV